MKQKGTLKYILKFAWIPVLFTILGVTFPFPMFSLHGGPAWLLLIISLPCILGFYIFRVVKAPAEERTKYLVLNVTSVIIYISLVWSASYLVAETVMSK